MLINTITPNSLLSPLCAIDRVYIGNETYSFTREKRTITAVWAAGSHVSLSPKGLQNCACALYSNSRNTTPPEECCPQMCRSAQPERLSGSVRRGSPRAAAAQTQRSAG